MVEQGTLSKTNIALEQSWEGGDDPFLFWDKVTRPMFRGELLVLEKGNTAILGVEHFTKSFPSSPETLLPGVCDQKEVAASEKLMADGCNLQIHLI